MPNNKAKKIPGFEWAEHRQTASTMFVNNSIEDIWRHFAGKGFPATLRQWKKKLTSDWGLRKNLRPAEKAFIVQQARSRSAHGKDTEALVNGRLLGVPKIHKLLRENPRGDALQAAAPPQPHDAGTAGDEAFPNIEIRTPRLSTAPLVPTGHGDAVFGANGEALTPSDSCEDRCARALILSRIVMQIVHVIWYQSFGQAPEKLEDAAPGFRNPLPNALVPEEDLHTATWLSNVLYETQLSHDIVILALLYIFRLKRRMFAFEGIPSEAKGLLTVALDLANKNIEDKAYDTATWVKLSGINSGAIRQAEIQFTLYLNLTPTTTEWQSWYTEVKKFAHTAFGGNPAIGAGLRNVKQCLFRRGGDSTVCPQESSLYPPCPRVQFPAQGSSQFMADLLDTGWINNLVVGPGDGYPFQVNEAYTPSASGAADIARTPLSDGSLETTQGRALLHEAGVPSVTESLRINLSTNQLIEGSGERFDPLVQEPLALTWRDVGDTTKSWQQGPVPLEGPQFGASSPPQN